MRSGATVYVTDRGRIVAEIKPSPPAADREQDVLRELAAGGVVTLGAAQHEDIEPARVLRGKKATSRMIIEDRR